VANLIISILKEGFKTPKITPKNVFFSHFLKKKAHQTYKISSHNKTIGGAYIGSESKIKDKMGSYWGHVGNFMGT
jgi:hypothetical protein